MSLNGETPTVFESRKSDHIRLSLEERMQADGSTGLNRIRLAHEALPDLDFSEVDISTDIFSKKISTPLFVSSMTAGHRGSLHLNFILAQAAERRGWAMGVGSQRRQLTDPSADQEWRDIRDSCPKARLFGNIGIAQLISSPVDSVRRLADSLQAEAMFVHLNPLQECMQPEGTPQFRGGWQALENLVLKLGLPVIVKETGCGFSQSTLARLRSTGVAVVDISGYGGTHWGRIEGGRAQGHERLERASQIFGDWGIPTVESLLTAVALEPPYAIWASGGVRSGLDAAKLLAMGAELVGFAKPLIEAALQGEQKLDKVMESLEFELKTAMFCSGVSTVADLRGKKLWQVVRTN
jgi:isopentenyl-diphosphate delta-isomerase